MALTLSRIVWCALHSGLKRRNVHWCISSSSLSSLRVVKRDWKLLKYENGRFNGRDAVVRVHHFWTMGSRHRQRSGSELQTTIIPAEGLRESVHFRQMQSTELKGAWADPFEDSNNRPKDRSTTIRVEGVRTEKSFGTTEEKVAICVENEGGKTRNPLSSEEQVAQGVKIMQ